MLPLFVNLKANLNHKLSGCLWHKVNIVVANQTKSGDYFSWMGLQSLSHITLLPENINWESHYVVTQQTCKLLINKGN